MLRLSKKTDYGLLALQYLANEAPSGVASARAIAERYDIPVELLAKVLQHLARFGFVAAQKGAHGGYQLARPAASISLADIVEAIDGPLAITACGRKDEQCDQYRLVHGSRSAGASEGSDPRRSADDHARRNGRERRHGGRHG